jgi:hypothetical protein
MKTGEAIHTGMRVWDREGRIWKVLSIIVEANAKHTVLLEASVGPLMMATSVPWDNFAKEFHCRRTVWEHCEKLDLAEPVYEGPATGYHCVRVSIYEGGTTRIPKRSRRAQEAVWAELEEVRRNAAGSYSEWYEHAKPEGAWALVLDPLF